jgi:hypothetical protein
MSATVIRLAERRRRQLVAELAGAWLEWYWRSARAWFAFLFGGRE